MPEPLILHLAGSAGEGVPLPLGLAGLPTEIEGKPVYYRRKQICRVVRGPHRGRKNADGSPFIVDIPPARLDLWASTFNRRLAKGIKPFLYPRHLDVDRGEQADARHTQGYLIDVDRDGGKLFGTLQLIGDEALACAAANDVSVTVTGDALDPECIHHVAFTPIPQVTGMDSYTALVASADGKAVEVPVLVLSSDNNPGTEPERSPIMKPETILKLRAKLNLADAKAVPDEEVAERAAVLALADPPADKTAEVTALSAQVTTLTKERDEAKKSADTATLALSAAAPKEYDPLALTLITESFGTWRDKAVTSGAISENGMKALDALLMPGGKPSPIALSLSAGGTRPLYAQVCEIIAGNPGVKTGHGVERAKQLALSGDGDKDEPMTPEREAELRRLVQLPPAKSA